MEEGSRGAHLDAMQLAEVRKQEFALVVTPEVVRQHFHSMGYRGSGPPMCQTKSPTPTRKGKP